MDTYHNDNGGDEDDTDHDDDGGRDAAASDAAAAAADDDDADDDDDDDGGGDGGGGDDVDNDDYAEIVRLKALTSVLIYVKTTNHSNTIHFDLKKPTPPQFIRSVGNDAHTIFAVSDFLVVGFFNLGA